MIHGIGTDIVRVQRMRAALERHGERFALRILAASEVADWRAHRDPGRFLAKRFAAKEAFGKAMGVGLSGWAMPEAAVTYGETGAPYFALSGEAEKLAEGWQLALSLSHDGGCAIAMVTAYRPD